MFIRTYSRKGLTDESWRWVVIYEGLKAERKEARRIRFVLWSTPQRTMYLNSQFPNRMKGKSSAPHRFAQHSPRS